MKVIVIGNSGTGKSTHARMLAQEHGLEHLDLDSIMWEPNQIAVLRPTADVQRDLKDWVGQRDRWVVEGVYGEIASSILAADVHLHFLNPGLDVCLRNNAARPWEPEKYETPELQQSMYETLIDWVKGYYTRDDAWSYAYHRAMYDGFSGTKTEILE